MRWVRRLTGSGASGAPDWSLDAVPRPWSGRSLHDFVEEGLDSDGRLRDDHAVLPDEKPADEGGLRWAPGALDGVVTSHTRGGPRGGEADLIAAIEAFAERADAARFAALDETIRRTEVLSVIDRVLQALAAPGEPRPRIAAIGRTLAREGVERHAVKVGIALIGVFGSAGIIEADVIEAFETLDVLGSHEEFTLFVAVALVNFGADEHALWSLARRVRGWGRIQLVHQMLGTQDPAIRAWMLRDGFRNSVMDEYLALECANAGGLREALAPDAIDDALFDGAADILAALARGGPAGDLTGYPDAEAVIARWLDHVEGRRVPLRAVSALDDLAATDGILSDDLEVRIDRMRRSEAAETAIRAGLESDDRVVFAPAAAAAHSREMDIFDRLLTWAAAGDLYATFSLFRDVDEARLGRALEMLRGRLDLVDLGSGPGDAFGLGEAFADHSALEYVTNALARFPGEGVDFVLAALRSPVIRVRHAAVRTIRAWGVDGQTPAIRAALERARGEELNEGVRDAIEGALA